MPFEAPVTTATLAFKSLIEVLLMRAKPAEKYNLQDEPQDQRRPPPMPPISLAEGRTAIRVWGEICLGMCSSTSRSGCPMGCSRQSFLTERQARTAHRASAPGSA